MRQKKPTGLHHLHTVTQLLPTEKCRWVQAGFRNKFAGSIVECTNGQNGSILASATIAIPMSVAPMSSRVAPHDPFDSRMYDMRLVWGVQRVRIERPGSVPQYLSGKALAAGAAQNPAASALPLTISDSFSN